MICRIQSDIILMSLDCGPTTKKDIKAFWDSTKSKKFSIDLKILRIRGTGFCICRGKWKMCRYLRKRKKCKINNVKKKVSYNLIGSLIDFQK